MIFEEKTDNNADEFGTIKSNIVNIIKEEFKLTLTIITHPGYMLYLLIFLILLASLNLIPAVTVLFQYLIILLVDIPMFIANIEKKNKNTVSKSIKEIIKHYEKIKKILDKKHSIELDKKDIKEEVLQKENPICNSIYTNKLIEIDKEAITTKIESVIEKIKDLDIREATYYYNEINKALEYYLKVQRKLIERDINKYREIFELSKSILNKRIMYIDNILYKELYEKQNKKENKVRRMQA